jgi:hypothetical protein
MYKGYKPTADAALLLHSHTTCWDRHAAAQLLLLLLKHPACIAQVAGQNWCWGAGQDPAFQQRCCCATLLQLLGTAAAAGAALATNAVA